MHSSPFPLTLGHDFSGTIAAIPPSYNGRFQPGDEVIGIIPVTDNGGAAAEMAVVPESRLIRKPQRLSHTEASALGIGFITAMVALDRGTAKLGGSLQGKTVFVPAALGGVGSAAVQLAKNVYSAGRVVGTVSTGKMGIVPEKLGDSTLDSLVDYTKEDVVNRVGKGKVDLYVDTKGTIGTGLGMVKKGGAVVSCTSLCSGPEMEKLMPTPWPMKMILNTVSWTVSKWYGFWGVNFEAILAVPNEELLERLEKYVEEGKIRGVVGAVVKLREENLGEIQKACETILAGKGGVGRFVIEMEQ